MIKSRTTQIIFQSIYIGIAIAVLVLVIAAIIIIKKSRTKKLKKEVEDLYVRFNAVKTVPLAFKLSKAQAMAKRSAETSASVEKYYTRYEEVEKHINQVQDLLNNVDDSIAESTYKESLESIRIASENLEDCEKEVKDIIQTNVAGELNESSSLKYFLN